MLDDSLSGFGVDGRLEFVEPTGDAEAWDIESRLTGLIGLSGAGLSPLLTKLTSGVAVFDIKSDVPADIDAFRARRLSTDSLTILRISLGVFASICISSLGMS